MAIHFKTDRDPNLIGSLWMVAAMAAFAVEDVLIKALSAKLPVAQILIIFGVGGALVFVCLALFKGERLFSSPVVSLPMRLRVVFLNYWSLVLRTCHYADAVIIGNGNSSSGTDCGPCWCCLDL